MSAAVHREWIGGWIVAVAAGCGVDVGEGPNLSGTGGPPTTAESSDGTPDGDDDGTPDDGSAGGSDTTAAATGDAGSSDDAPADATTDAPASTSGAGSSSDDAGSESSDTGPVSDGDLDDDDLPDDDDPFPNDPNLPGTVALGYVYAQTADRLFTMDVTDYAIAEVGMFAFPSGGAGLVTDIAIDRFGVLYAITFNDLHACNPATAECYQLAALPSESNGLTFVPPGTIDPVDDTLIGIAIAGDWRQMDVVGGVVAQVVLGGYGNGYTSSGDAFSIGGVGTFAAVDAPGTFNDVIIDVDPLDGSALGEITELVGYSGVYGLAGWEGSIFAFDESGTVLLIDPSTGEVTVIAQTAYAWWGAAVATVLPS